jgi:hypothetical protein
MSTLNTIAAYLFKIRQALVSHPVFARGTGVAIDDSAYVREAEELERMSDSLDLLIRNLPGAPSLRFVQGWDSAGASIMGFALRPITTISDSQV